MGKLSIKGLLGVSIAYLLLQMGCCPPCEKSFLGEYLILSETQQWFEFVDTSPRLFTSSAGTQRTFTYETPVRGLASIQENCEENSCALCCDELNAETLTYRLTDGGGGLIFQIQVEKDFAQEGGPNDLPDTFLFSLNNAVRSTAGDLPENAILTNITLNGQTFNGVLACEIPVSNADAAQENIYAYYFQPEKGIVGFIQADGTEWALSL